jgi:hypothetical protein
MWMKGYVVILLQFIIWSAYSVIVWLSKHDLLIFNNLMFIVFLYIAFLIGNIFMKSTKKTVMITMISLFLYSVIHFSLPLLPLK